MGPIHLVVGGVSHWTTQDTLQKYVSFFSSCVDYSQNEVVFIDRDPTHFRHILNYLRGTPTYPSRVNEMTELVYEAEFYALFEFATLIKNKAADTHKNTIEHWMSLLVNKINM